MVMMFIAFTVVVLSFNFFVVSYQINGINRLVIYAPLSIFETALDFYDLKEDEKPTFDKQALLDNLTSYFDYHMPRYTSDYHFTTYYYRIDTLALDLTDHPSAVEVLVNATVALNITYHGSMQYEIRSN